MSVEYLALGLTPEEPHRRPPCPAAILCSGASSGCSNRLGVLACDSVSPLSGLPTARPVSVAASRGMSRLPSENGTHDEHAAVRDEVRQVVRQALDVFARLLLPALHFEDLC